MNSMGQIKTNIENEQRWETRGIDHGKVEHYHALAVTIQWHCSSRFCPSCCRFSRRSYRSSRIDARASSDRNLIRGCEGTSLVSNDIFQLWTTSKYLLGFPSSSTISLHPPASEIDNGRGKCISGFHVSGHPAVLEEFDAERVQPQKPSRKVQLAWHMPHFRLPLSSSKGIAIAIAILFLFHFRQYPRQFRDPGDR